MNLLIVNKCMLGLLAMALSPLSLVAQQMEADIVPAGGLPDAPSYSLVAASSSAAQNPAPTAPPADLSTSGSQQPATPANATPNAAPQQPSTSAQQPSTSTQQPSAPAAGQNSTAPGTQAQPQTEEQRRAKAERELKQEESQRMLGVIPNFNTVIGGEAEPITPRQKFRLFFKSSVDPFQFFAAGVDAGIEQAEDSYPEYRQGLKGFAKRYGAAFADGFDGNFWGNAVLPSLLHQDPRYFRLGHGSFKHRLLYSIYSTVRTKGDNGRWEPNYSNIAGNFIGGAISNAYYPASDRGVGLTLERGLTVSAEGAIGSLAVEFYPDVVQHYRNKRLSKLQTQPAADGTTPTPKP